MATNVLMPKWGMTMQQGMVTCWLKKEGDPVEQGEEIVEVESEKATSLVEAPASGVIARILVPEGETVPITTVIAIIAAPGEELPQSVAADVGQHAASLPNQSVAETSGRSVSAPHSGSRRVAASPAARRLAREHNVELSQLDGTGPDGMIVVEDVRAVLTATLRPAALRDRTATSEPAVRAESPVTRVAFYSHGHKLDGILYLPKDRPVGRLLPGVVFCLGFTYVKDLLVPEMARRLSARGYASLVFDYRGFGKSEGPRGQLFPIEQVADIRAAMTFLAARPEVDAGRIGLVGISLGGSHALYVAGTDQRVRAAAAISPVGDGRRWLRGCRRYWEWVDWVQKIEADRAARVRHGEGTRVPAWEIVPPDPASGQFLEALYRQFPEIQCELSLESADALIDYCPESVVGRTQQRPVLLVHGEADRLVPVDESRSLFARCGEPRELVILPDMGHFDWAVPQDARFDRIMEIISRWLDQYLGQGAPA